MRYAITFVLALLLAGCASNPQLPYQYATLKLIEKEAVTAEAVIDRVEGVRDLLDGEVDMPSIRDAANYQDLAPSDRLLVDAIIGDVQGDLGLEVGEPLDEEQKTLVLERLRWIEQAAQMSQ